jgi:Ca-activated chloride channel family protein
MDLDFSSIRFEAPAYLPLLILPAGLLLLWIRQMWLRRRDAHRYRRARLVPVKERIPIFGDLLSWLSLLVALVFAILALAKPVAVVATRHTGGVDLVVLQDGSASMHVKDVLGNRWQRSVAFLRVLGESLRWENDRVALALFAHIATPQVRLTRDPNTLFFFLDHLGEAPPFRLEDDASWDTNIERGVYWGVRLVRKDEELGGKSLNGKAFVLISDGQAWSGEVAKALALAQQNGIPVFVVGVGTTVGGMIPDPTGGTRLRSFLDRNSLSVIATAGGGRYFELDREPDREIASAIIDLTRRRAISTGLAEETMDLYGRALLAAAACLALAVLFLGDRAGLVLQLVAAGATLVSIGSII